MKSSDFQSVRMRDLIGHSVRWKVLIGPDLGHGALQQRAGDLHRDDGAIGDVVLYQLSKLKYCQVWILYS